MSRRLPRATRPDTLCPYLTLFRAALAAAGASSDILAAARRVDAAVANPAIETFPSGDLARLVASAGGLERAFGGTPFPGAQADIIRTYIGWLAAGNGRADFLTAYAGFLGQYLDLIRSGRSEEPTSELQSLMRNSYAVFCLKKKKKRDK